MPLFILQLFVGEVHNVNRQKGGCSTRLTHFVRPRQLYSMLNMHDSPRYLYYIVSTKSFLKSNLRSVLFGVLCAIFSLFPLDVSLAIKHVFFWCLGKYRSFEGVMKD